MLKNVFAVSAPWLLVAGAAAAQHAIIPYAAVPFAQDADVACLASSLETGNPSTFILKAPAGCIVPWHWHTAREQLMVVSGGVMAHQFKWGRRP
jgi:hypothetical protein